MSKRILATAAALAAVLAFAPAANADDTALPDAPAATPPAAAPATPAPPVCEYAAQIRVIDHLQWEVIADNITIGFRDDTIADLRNQLAQRPPVPPAAATPEPPTAAAKRAASLQQRVYRLQARVQHLRERLHAR